MHIITLEEVKSNLEAYKLGVERMGECPCSDGIYDPDEPRANVGVVEERILQIMESL